jgi:hypothetical protein
MRGKTPLYRKLFPACGIPIQICRICHTYLSTCPAFYLEGLYLHPPDGPPPSHNENYVHSWLQDTAEAHQLLLDKIVCFAMSDFGGTHAGFRLMITCAVRRYGFLLRTLPPYICRPYLTTEDRAVRTAVYRILGVSHDVQTLYKLNCAKRQLSIAAEFGGLNVPSLELDAEPARYATFTAILANLIIDYESESLGPLYGIIRHDLLNIATSTLPWAVQLRNSYDSISTMGGFSESDLVVTWCY